MVKWNVFPLPEYSKAIIIGLLHLDSSLPNNTNVDAFLFISYRISDKVLLAYNRLREEKVKEKQKYQEERLKAALERAVAQPKKKVGLGPE